MGAWTSKIQTRIETMNLVGLPRCGGPAPKARPFATTRWMNSTHHSERPARRCRPAGDGATRQPYHLDGSCERIGAVLRLEMPVKAKP